MCRIFYSVRVLPIFLKRCLKKTRNYKKIDAVKKIKGKFMTSAKKILAISAIAGMALASFAATKTSEKTAMPVSEDLQKSTIYQILPQHFTQEGTLKKAADFLPHIKSLGVDIIYLCPVAEADRDENRDFWSKRQKASGLNNPCNPYRIRDYFKIDPRFGGDADLKRFVEKAHKLGLKVILDLVYYHCGPKAVFIEKNPDFVVRNPDGTVKNGFWNFPELNFKSKGLREYLIKNMLYFIEKFGVDGYRTDVEKEVPADFWAEAYARISKIKPDVIMLAESHRETAQLDAYNINYSFRWTNALIYVFSGKAPAHILKKIWSEQNSQFPKGARLLRALDNHDTASDSCQPEKGGARYESQFGNSGMDAIQLLNFTIDGIPFIYNGNEFADNTYFSMFSDNKHGRFFVAWENIASEEGRKRMALIRKLNSIRKKNSEFWRGETVWIDNSNPDCVVSFMRRDKISSSIVLVNTRNAHLDAKIKIDFKKPAKLISDGAKYQISKDELTVSFEPNGYIVLKCEQ